MNESGRDFGPWKPEFNFAPNELPDEMRKALAPYFAGMGMPTVWPKFQRPPAMNPAQVLECANKAEENLKALHDQAFWHGDGLAATLFAGQLCLAVEKLTKLVNNRPELLADFAPKMPRFPLNCSLSRPIREANENLMKRLHVGEKAAPSKPAKTGGLQPVAESLLNKLQVLRWQFYLRHPDEAERQRILEGCDEIEHRLIALPEILGGRITREQASDWFEVAWCLLKRQTQDQPEKLPALAVKFHRYQQSAENRWFKKRAPDGARYNSGKYPNPAKYSAAIRRLQGFKTICKSAAASILSDARAKLKEHVKAEFLALFGLRPGKACQTKVQNPQ